MYRTYGTWLGIFATGAFFGVWVANATLKKEYQEELRRHTAEKNHRIREERSEESAGKKLERMRTEKDKIDIGKYKEAVTKEGYARSSPAEDVAPITEAVPVPLSEEDNSHEEPLPPYRIHFENFFNDFEFDKSNMYYYHEYDILVNEDDEHIHNLSLYIPDGVLDKFGEEAVDEYVVYVRNERLMTDFEIVKKDGPPPVYTQI